MKLLAEQPKPFYLIFLLEIWERFGFYTLNALAVLFMVQSLGYTDKMADILFTSFMALAFLFPSVGGFIGDRVLGTKRTIIVGLVVLMIGYALLSIPAVTHYSISLPLAVIAVGTGIFKPNPSSMLSKVYEGTSYSRDSGFTLYYMAINIGMMLATIVAPIIQKHLGWHAAFSASVIGMILANGSYFFMRETILPYGSPADAIPLNFVRVTGLLVLGVGVTLLCWFLLRHNYYISWLLGCGITLFILFFIYEIFRAEKKERNGMILFLILFIQAIIFFVMYFQIPTSLTLFALRNVRHSLWGMTIHPAQYQALNPIWIFIMSPILASLYNRLTAKNKDFSIPAKFALGILLTGFSFIIIPFGSLTASQGILSGWWLVLAYWFESTGELLVSALGLSLVARYVPQRMMGYTMGLWFVCVSIASVIGGHVASLASIPENLVHNPKLSLSIYNHIFLMLGFVTILISVVLFLFVPLLNKLAVPKQG